MAKLTDEQRQKIKEASQGLRKVTPEQAKQIQELYLKHSPKFEQVKKLVHKSVLFKITGAPEFAPKMTQNRRAEELNKILFS